MLCPSSRHPSPVTPALVLLALVLLAPPVSSRTILDLEEDVQYSVPYNKITLACAKCALVAYNDGCWGSAHESAVKVSGCVDGSIDCFCAEDVQEATAAYILDLAEKVCIKAGTSNAAEEYLAVWAYGEFCNTTFPEPTTTRTTSSSTLTSTSTQTSSSSLSPTSDPKPDPLHPVELFGIIFGSIIGACTLLVGILQFRHSRRGEAGFFIDFSCGRRHQANHINGI